MNDHTTEDGGFEDTAQPGDTEADRRRALRDDLLVEAIAFGQTYAQAAAAAGCSRRTVEREMAKPAFKLRVAERRAERYHQVEGLLANIAPVAVMVLASHFVGPDSLKAVLAALDKAYAYRNLELDRQVLELRQAVADFIGANGHAEDEPGHASPTESAAELSEGEDSDAPA
jgi:hypothetical protein